MLSVPAAVPVHLAAILAWVATCYQPGSWLGSRRRCCRQHSSQPGLSGPLPCHAVLVMPYPHAVARAVDPYGNLRGPGT